MRIGRTIIGILVGSSLVWHCLAISAQPQVDGPSTRRQVRYRPYDGLRAGWEAYQIHEAQRLADLAWQRDLNHQVTWFYGYGVWAPDRYDPWQMSGATGSASAEWQMTPGGIWGYPPLPLPIEQPIGREEFQDGPDRWVSRPVYAPRQVPQPIARRPIPRQSVRRELQPVAPAPRELSEPEPIGPREF